MLPSTRRTVMWLPRKLTRLANRPHSSLKAKPKRDMDQDYRIKSTLFYAHKCHTSRCSVGAESKEMQTGPIKINPITIYRGGPAPLINYLKAATFSKMQAKVLLDHNLWSSIYAFQRMVRIITLWLLILIYWWPNWFFHSSSLVYLFYEIRLDFWSII